MVFTELDQLAKIDAVTDPSGVVCYSGISEQYLFQFFEKITVIDNEAWRFIYRQSYSDELVEFLLARTQPTICDQALIARNHALSEEFFEKHLGLFCSAKKNTWQYSEPVALLCEHPGLSGEFYEKHFNLVEENDYFWYRICCNNGLPEEFFEKYFSYIVRNPKNLIPLCQLLQCSQQFFERHIDEILKEDRAWSSLSSNPNCGIDFWNRYFDRIDWRAIGKNTSLDQQFYFDNQDRLKCWRELAQREDILVSFILAHLDKLNRSDYYHWAGNPSLSLEIAEQYFLTPDSEYEWFRNFVACNRNLTVEFLSKHMDRLDPSTTIFNLAVNRNFSQENFEIILQKFSRPSRLDRWYRMSRLSCNIDDYYSRRHRKVMQYLSEKMKGISDLSGVFALLS